MGDPEDGFMGKRVKQELCKPLTIIINQMIETGVYPEKFKISKITPIYKKNERTNIANYRPISLLPKLSKIFERVIHTQLYTLMKISCYPNNNTDFVKNILPN